MKIVVYEMESGKILRAVECAPNMVALQCQPGEEFYLNCPDSATHILDSEPVTVASSPPLEDELLSEIRQERNRRLSSSDWTQMPDAPLSADVRSAWQAYRQSLRDFPALCNPVIPEWPVPPSDLS